MKGGKIRGTGRLKDTTNVLAESRLLKLKTACLVEERRGGCSLSYQGRPRQGYCCQQLCLVEKWRSNSSSSAVKTICVYFECWVPLWNLNIYNAVKGLVLEGETVTLRSWPQLGQLHAHTHTLACHSLLLIFSSMQACIFTFTCAFWWQQVCQWCAKQPLNPHWTTCSKFSALRRTTLPHTNKHTGAERSKGLTAGRQSQTKPCYIASCKQCIINVDVRLCCTVIERQRRDESGVTHR